ncbi:MAG: hypothetical protein RIC55_19520 [Pirellulaceae bacterium]
MTMLVENFLEDHTESSPPTPFLLYWRFRPTHPWNLERFSERPKAHNRFFNLLERGIEARFETTREATTHRAASQQHTEPRGRSTRRDTTSPTALPNVARAAVN